MRKKKWNLDSKLGDKGLKKVNHDEGANRWGKVNAEKKLSVMQQRNEDEQ